MAFQGVWDSWMVFQKLHGALHYFTGATRVLDASQDVQEFWADYFWADIFWANYFWTDKFWADFFWADYGAN